jgi:organic radical activating enzyme
MNVEIYKPTKEDLERIKPRPDQLKISGDGVFATLQGEGITTGYPSVFLRLHYCNLTCGVPRGWQCDTGYTWDRTRPEFWQEPENWSYDETVLRIEQGWQESFGNNESKRLVITGGEPLIQQCKIAKLLERLSGWEVEIETNGTIIPIPELHHCQFNCSPKLANSGILLKRRYKPEVLRIIDRLPKSQFKFVVLEPADLEEVNRIVNECALNPKKILIMPEGHTAEEVEIHAGKLRSAVEARGWKITMRNQFIWYGSKRKT